jgi:hypothetical protein
MPPKTAAGTQRALANLVQNRAHRITSGAFGIVPAEAVAAKQAEILGLLGGKASGWLRASDAVTVELLARALARLEAIDRTGALDAWLRRQTTSARPTASVPGFVKIYMGLLERSQRLAESLGLSPTARSRLGVAAVKTMTLADYVAERYGTSAEKIATHPAADPGDPASEPEASSEIDPNDYCVCA